MTQFSGSHSGVPALREYGICGILYFVVSMKENKIYGGALAELHAFLISALDGSKFFVRRSQRSIPEKKPENQLNGRMGGNHRPSGNLAKRKYLSSTGNPRRFIGYSANSPVIIPTELYQLACLVV
jgi:hypothetical protein